MSATENAEARRRRLSVAGVAGGVGTTTVATAIGGVDRGVFVGRAVDVLVCRATGDSLVRAGRAAQLIVQATGRRPVIAVTAADSSGPSRPVTARLRLLQPHAARIVVLPFVRRWRELATPLDDARGLLTAPRAELPRGLRRYADGVREVRAAVGGPVPPLRRPSIRAAVSASTSILGRTP